MEQLKSYQSSVREQFQSISWNTSTCATAAIVTCAFLAIACVTKSLFSKSHDPYPERNIALPKSMNNAEIKTLFLPLYTDLRRLIALCHKMPKSGMCTQKNKDDYLEILNTLERLSLKISRKTYFYRETPQYPQLIDELHQFQNALIAARNHAMLYACTQAELFKTIGSMGNVIQMGIRDPTPREHPDKS